MQLRQYGLTSLPDNKMDDFVEHIMNDDRQRNTLIDQVLDNKVIAYIKSVIELDEKTVSLEEFNKLFEQ
jgi:trigger factor